MWHKCDKFKKTKFHIVLKKNIHREVLVYIHGLVLWYIVYIRISFMKKSFVGI